MPKARGVLLVETVRKPGSDTAISAVVGPVAESLGDAVAGGSTLDVALPMILRPAATG